MRLLSTINILALYTIFLSLVISPNFSNAQASRSNMETWTGHLTNKYQEIAESILRTSEHEQYLENRAQDTNNYDISERNGDVEVDRLKSTLSAIIKEKTDLAYEIRDEMTKAIRDYTRETGSPQYIDSSDPADIEKLDLENIPRYPAPVDMTQSAIKFAPGVDRESQDVKDHLFMSQNLDSLFRKNKDKTIWQYFGSQTGFHRQYPAREWTKGPDGEFNPFDPRTRPWYVGSTSGPKDVIILFDRSGSMSNSNRMSTARDATKTVLDTLTTRDYVNVIMFNSNAETDYCFSDVLVPAIPRNIDRLKQYLDLTSASGNTNFEKAFEKAFDLIEESRRQGQGTSCETLILFMTDGQADDPSSIIEERKSTDLPLSIFSYSFGAGASEEVPRKIACENNGIFASIPDGGDLVGQMSSYYEYFAAGILNREVTWTAPYWDATGLGLISTVAVPVYDERSNPPQLAGVVGTDIVVSELLFEAYTLQEQKSYAFIINQEGQVLAHPLLKPPTNYQEPPSHTDISEIENADKIDTIRNAMIEGRSGSFSEVDVTQSLPAGDIQYEGVRTRSYTASYFYRKIEYGPFSVAVVLAEEDQEKFQWNNVLAENVPSSVYHRIDQYTPPGVDANRVNIDDDLYLTYEASTVKIAPRGFEKPFEYETIREDSDEVEAFTQYINTGDQSNAPLTLQRDVSNDIRLTRHIESSWMNYSTPYVEYQTIGTESGMMRVYPGFNADKSFDPTIRPWYLRAVAKQSSRILTVSTPYQDAGNENLNIVTISKLIPLPKSSSSAISGVMGLDFSYSTFAQNIQDTIGACRESGKQCYLIDDSGMLVVHPEFSTSESSSNIFMGQKDDLAGVTQFLIDENILNAANYSDMQTLQTIKYYLISDQIGSYYAFSLSENSYCNQGDYALAPIENTNLYLLVAENTRSSVFNCQHTAPEQGQINICKLNSKNRVERCPAFSLSNQQLDNLRGGTCDASPDESDDSNSATHGCHTNYILAGATTILVIAFGV